MFGLMELEAPNTGSDCDVAETSDRAGGYIYQ